MAVRHVSTSRCWLLALPVIAAILIFQLRWRTLFLSDSGEAAAACASTVETRLVRGDSLSPALRDGSRVRLALDPGHCLPISRGELVAFSDPGHPQAPVLKRVHGLPGDRFRLARDGGLYGIEINGRAARNSRGLPFRLPPGPARILGLYEKDYRGVIPPGAYLLLGEALSGGRDSTRLGLIGRKDIVGKMLSD